MLAKTITVIVLIFLILPIIILIPISLSPTTYVVFPPGELSLRWFKQIFLDRGWINAIGNSLIIALFTVFCSLLLGITASLCLRRVKLKYRLIFNEFFRLPQIIPIIVTAIALFGLLGKLKLVGTIPGMVIAHTVLAMPIVIATISASFDSIDLSYEMAARNLGAGPLRVFFDVTLHLIKPAIFSSAIFAFLTSFDEIAVTLFITGPGVKTLPQKMWDGIRLQIEPTIAAISTLFVLLLIIVFMAMGIVNFKSNHKRL